MASWVMGERDLERTLKRLADELSERLGDPEGYALVGIVRGGAWVAERLAQAIVASEGARPLVGTLDITLYRDDLYTGLEKPTLGESRIPFDLSGRQVVLVDDVLFTGRTVRAALDELMDYGRPRRVYLAVLVDRGHRELPVAADFVGRTIQTAKRDRVVVHLRQDGSPTEGVEVVAAPPAAPPTAPPTASEVSS